jgi:hypothetical protein
MIPPVERQVSFKSQHFYETRKEVAAHVREMRPDSYPIIVELDPEAEKIIAITKKRFLVSGAMPIEKFLSLTRHKIVNDTKMDGRKALAFSLERHTRFSGDDTVKTLYDNYKDLDGFLYFRFNGDESVQNEAQEIKEKSELKKRKTGEDL